LLSREECERSSQGKKVADGRCGITIEAQPLSGQTCPIEPADGAPETGGGKDIAMAVETTGPFENGNFWNDRLGHSVNCGPTPVKTRLTKSAGSTEKSARYRS
jgi:hypothetical protein